MLRKTCEVGLTELGESHRRIRAIVHLLKSDDGVLRAFFERSKDIRRVVQTLGMRHNAFLCGGQREEKNGEKSQEWGKTAGDHSCQWFWLATRRSAFVVYHLNGESLLYVFRESRRGLLRLNLGRQGGHTTAAELTTDASGCDALPPGTCSSARHHSQSSESLFERVMRLDRCLSWLALREPAGPDGRALTFCSN